MQATHFLAQGSFAGEQVDARNFAWSKPVRLGLPEGILVAVKDVRASLEYTVFFTYVFWINASSDAGTSELWKSGSFPLHHRGDAKTRRLGVVLHLPLLNSSTSRSTSSPIKQPRNISHTAAPHTYTDTRERNEEEASHHMITSSLLPNCEPHKHPSVPSSRFLSDGCANRACHLSEAQGHQVAGIHRQINLTASNAYSTRSKLEKDDERQRDEPHHSSQYSSHSRSISTRTSTQHHAAHGITHAHFPHV